MLNGEYFDQATLSVIPRAGDILQLKPYQLKPIAEYTVRKVILFDSHVVPYKDRNYAAAVHIMTEYEELMVQET